MWRLQRHSQCHSQHRHIHQLKHGTSASAGKPPLNLTLFHKQKQPKEKFILLLAAVKFTNLCGKLSDHMIYSCEKPAKNQRPSTLLFPPSFSPDRDIVLVT